MISIRCASNYRGWVRSLAGGPGLTRALLEFDGICRGGVARSASRDAYRTAATGETVCDAPARGSMRLLVTDRPYIICHRGEIGLGELGATHGRHYAGVLLGFWYTVRDRPGNRLDAAIAP